MSDLWITFKLGAYEAHHYKIAISLPELVESTNRFSIKNREGCQPTLKGSDPQDLFLKYNVKCNLPSSDPKGHEVRVHFDVSKVTPEMRANDLDIRCACSCPAFLYWGAQYNLKQRDALEGTPRPILQAPTERLDLRNNFIICKHLKAVFERILPSVQHNIMKIVRQRDMDSYKQKHPEGTPSKERLVREQERMKQRQELKKQRDRRNKRIQQDMMEVLRKQEEERLLQEQLDEEEKKPQVTRTNPAKVEAPPSPAEQKQKLKKPEKPKPHVHDEEKGHEENHALLNQMLEEERKKLEKQQEENRKRRKRVSSLEGFHVSSN